MSNSVEMGTHLANDEPAGGLSEDESELDSEDQELSAEGEENESQ